MADTANTAPTAADNPYAQFLEQADQIQGLASRLGHLARAISDAGDRICDAHLGKHDQQAVCGIIAFADMAREMADKIAEAGERVELAANQARRA